jgi:hypothetical protein
MDFNRHITNLFCPYIQLQYLSKGLSLASIIIILVNFLTAMHLKSTLYFSLYHPSLKYNLFVDSY